LKNNQGHGGRREGAGRKPNSPNKASAARQAQVAATGETPLEYMLRVMRDPTADEKRRDEMAVKAAPYVHPRLSSVDANVKGDLGLKVEIVRFADAPAS
jgi:hypothetical protein